MRAPSLHIEPVALTPEVLLALAARAPARYPVLLDSAAQGALSQFSLLAALPRGCLWLDAAGTLHADGDLPAPTQTGFLACLDALWSEHAQPSAPLPVELPFRGGWFAYL